MPDQDLIRTRGRLAGLYREPDGMDQDFGSIDFERIVKVMRPALAVTIKLWGAISVIGFFILLLWQPAYAFPFLCMVGGSCALAFFWLNAGGRSLPLVPLFAAQNGFIYGLPLLVRNESLAVYSEDLLWPGAVAFLIYMCSAGFGWRLGNSRKVGRPARWRFALPSKTKLWNKGLAKAGFLLLGASLIFEILIRSGLYWSLLGGIAWQVFPIARTLFEAFMLIGALLGGFAAVSRKIRACFYFVVGLLFLFKVSDLLISSALGLVLAAVIGLLFGRRRIPWIFLIATITVAGFFNQSKFVMRERYWDKETNSNSASLSQLPRFYMEWIAESSALLAGSETSGIKTQNASRGGMEGQSFYNRIDNLQNLLYVLDALTVKGIPALNGEGYSLIPALFIPRIFWPDKPRTHEGQILLNLHFGRQSTIEETEHTNIAWGLLPEAIGNLGLNLGPFAAGIVIGWLLGRVEAWSRRKQILSIEGLLGFALLLQTALCFEMAASVLVTSTFQLAVAVAIGGFVIRTFVLTGRPVKPLSEAMSRNAAARH